MQAGVAVAQTTAEYAASFQIPTPTDVSPPLPTAPPRDLSQNREHTVSRAKNWNGQDTAVTTVTQQRWGQKSTVLWQGRVDTYVDTVEWRWPLVVIPDDIQKTS